MKRLDALLSRGVADGVFPLARAEVWLDGTRVWHGGNGPEDTVFDVASLTKVMCTTALCLELHRAGRLPLDTPVNRFFPGSSLVATLFDLLFHRSGLPAFLPFFTDVLRAHPELHAAECPAATRAQVRHEVLDRVAKAPATQAVGAQAVYSDLGFLLLGSALEQTMSVALDSLFSELIARPLGLSAGFRRISAKLPLPASFADTGTTRPREPAPGQEGLWTIDSRPTNRGEVDDDNAWVLDGVAGHAGLFATASDAAQFGQVVLDGERLAPPIAWAVDTLTPGSTRALGFDTPSAGGASCGPRFGQRGPRGAIGHTGFTGTSLWIDLDRRLVVALLSNRVALGRSNLKIHDFRPRFHDAVLDALAL